MFGRAALTFLVATVAFAQSQPSAKPIGMYNGGNETVTYARSIRATGVSGTVVDSVESTSIPRARVQVQIQGSGSILVDVTADARGRFRLPKLNTGTYWLGISASGFDISIWSLHIVRVGLRKKLVARLHIGT
jgi:hypothetical protein